MLSNIRTSSIHQSIVRLIAVCSFLFSLTSLVNSVSQPDRNKDFSLWYGIGIEVRNDRPLYQSGPNNEIVYLYPPTAAVLIFAPLTLLGHTGLVMILQLMTMAAWIGSLITTVQLVFGRWLNQPRWIYLFLTVCVGPYIYDLFLLGQINLVLLFLVLLAQKSLDRGYGTLAGVFLGLAIAIKVFPILILFYCGFRSAWKTVAVSIISTIMFVQVLPGIIRGQERNAIELKVGYASRKLVANLFTSV